jgi:hypothetical protein
VRCDGVFVERFLSRIETFPSSTVRDAATCGTYGAPATET